MAEKITVPCMMVKQNSWTLYCFTLSSSVLDEIAFVSRRDANKEVGYQRNLSEQRAVDIAHYLDDDKGCIPNSILVNLDSAQFNKTKRTLTIPRKSNSAWIIDGQHRMFGLRRAKGQFDVVVTAFIGLDIEKQAKQFKTINSKQKGVPTSLLYDLLDLTKDGTFVQQRGHDLAARLNSAKESPWRDRIDMTGSGGGLITQTRVVTALEPLISEKGSLFQYSEEEQYKILRNYYAALQALFPKDWGSKQSVLTKAIGFSAALILLPQVLTLALQRHGDFKSRSVTKVLQPISEYDFSSEKHKGWAGHPGENRLAAALADSLKKATNSASSGVAKIKLD